MNRALATVACLLVPCIAAAQSPGIDPANAMVTHHQGGSPASEPGQAAFAAIQEIVGILAADPATDWSRVSVDALRDHLVDMDNVTLKAVVASQPVDGGMRFQIAGSGSVQDSIRRMVTAHANTMDGVDGWRFEASVTSDGAELTVLPTADDRSKLGGLGFFGVMARGIHHHEHHLMLARGLSSHD